MFGKLTRYFQYYGYLFINKYITQSNIYFGINTLQTSVYNEELAMLSPKVSVYHSVLKYCYVELDSSKHSVLILTNNPSPLFLEKLVSKSGFVTKVELLQYGQECNELNNDNLFTYVRFSQNIKDPLHRERVESTSELKTTKGFLPEFNNNDNQLILCDDHLSKIIESCGKDFNVLIIEGGVNIESFSKILDVKKFDRILYCSIIKRFKNLASLSQELKLQVSSRNSQLHMILKMGYKINMKYVSTSYTDLNVKILIVFERVV